MSCCLCFEIYLTAVCCSCVGSLLCFIIPSCVHNRDQGDTDAYRVVVAVFSLLYLIKVQFHCPHEVVFSLFCFLSLLCYTRRCVSTAVLYTEVCFHCCVIHGGVFTSEAKGTLADASGGSWRFSHQPFLQHLIMVYVMVVLCCLFVCLLFSLTDNSPTSISYNTTSFARRENYD